MKFSLLLFRQLAKEFSDILKQDRSPVNVASTGSSNGGLNNNRHGTGSSSSSSSSSMIGHHLHSSISGPLDQNVQRSLTHFSLITHGFGAPALTAAVDIFQQYLAEMLKYYEKNYPMFIATTSTSSSSSIKNGLAGIDWLCFVIICLPFFSLFPPIVFFLFLLLFWQNTHEHISMYTYSIEWSCQVPFCCSNLDSRLSEMRATKRTNQTFFAAREKNWMSFYLSIEAKTQSIYLNFSMSGSSSERSMRKERKRFERQLVPRAIANWCVYTSAICVNLLGKSLNMCVFIRVNKK